MQDSKRDTDVKNSLLDSVGEGEGGMIWEGSIERTYRSCFGFISALLIFYVMLVIRIIKSVQSLSHVWLFVTPWIAARQASLSITNSRSSLRLTSIESVMPSSHLILCRPLLLLPPTPPSIRVFSNESILCIRWPKYWSFSFSISPFSEYSRIDFL